MLGQYRPGGQVQHGGVYRAVCPEPGQDLFGRLGVFKTQGGGAVGTNDIGQRGQAGADGLASLHAVINEDRRASR